MEAAPKSKTRKVVAAALAAAMVATVAPTAALMALNGNSGDGAGVESAYAATTADKLSAAAASSASQTPYAATLAKDKVAGWDGSSKVKVISRSDYPKRPDGNWNNNADDIYSDGTDSEGNYSPDSGKPLAEMVKGCSGVSKEGVRWAFTGGKVKNDDDGWGDYTVAGGTLYVDYDGVFDPLTWNESINYDFVVSVSSDFGGVAWTKVAKNVVIGKHVTELAYRSMEGQQWGDDQVLTFEEPSSLTKVASKAFINSCFKKITFPASLKTVEKDAIWGGSTGVRGDISYKDPANTTVDPGAIVYPEKEGSKAAKKVGKIKKLTAGKKSLTVSMKRVAGGKAYRVYYAVKGSDKYKSKLVKKLTAKNSTKSTVTYTIKGLKKGKKYQVHYIAYKKTSAKSSSAITRTPDKTSPAVK